MNIAYMALYGEGTDLLGYVLLKNMQLARATLDVELKHMRLGALLAIAEGIEAAPRSDCPLPRRQTAGARMEHHRATHPLPTAANPTFLKDSP